MIFLPYNVIFMRVTTTNIPFHFGLLLFLTLSLIPQFLHAQRPAGLSARSLDALVQDYAFRAFHRPITGFPYNAHLPSNLTGLQVSATRLRSGSLRTKGFHTFKEFKIPTGVLEQPYVERLVLVYQNLGNWSVTFYPLPGYAYLAPVLGLLAYDGSKLSATDLPELDIRASASPILIQFSDLEPVPDGLHSTVRCVSFDLHGSVQFDILLPGNVCSAFQQGHFSVVVETIAPTPSPVPMPNGGDDDDDDDDDDDERDSGEKKKHKPSVWIIVGSLVGSFLALTVLSLLGVRLCSKNENQVKQMEWMTEGSEDFHITTVSNARAPVAMVTRTKPMLENEYYC